VQETITGKKADKCLATYLDAPDNKRVCEYSQQTIMHMTTEAKYKEMRECKRFSMSSEDPAFIGQLKECDSFSKGKKLLKMMPLKEGEPIPTIDLTDSQIIESAPPAVKQKDPNIPIDLSDYYKDYRPPQK
jgi:hypothetical protein